MGNHELGRILDPDALEASSGPRARLRIEVPAGWLIEGAELEVRAPARLTCARCEGGGCDACGKSGAMRVPQGANRSLRVRLPLGGGEPTALRLVDPFGDEAVEQLLLEIRPGAAPSAGVERIARPPAPRAAPAPTAGFVLLGASLVAALLIALARC